MLVQSSTDSTPRKFLTATCTGGKRVTGAEGFTDTQGTVIESISFDANRLAVQVIGRAEVPSADVWIMKAVAFCTL